MTRPQLLLVVALLAGGCAADPDAAAEREVVVFAAASLREALEELGRAFEAETGVRVVFNFAGSNVLARQIEAAPGADLFLSASEEWMDAVARAGRLVDGTRRDLLSNTLVVVAHARSGFEAAEPCALAALPFDYLAVGDPEVVPAGRYARAWMASLDCGGRSLWEAVRARVAPSPDVRAALGLVLADPDLVGVVYRTDWQVFDDRARVLYEVAGGPAIRYVLARVDGGKAPVAAGRFAAYLAGDAGRSTFERHGFVFLSGPAPDSLAAP